MRLFGGLFAVLLIVGAIVLFNSFYVVRQDQQALVLQLGDPREVRNETGENEAGLFFKTPFVQQVVVLDKKNLGLDIPNIEVLASDQRRLVVDAFVRWRINDPLEFYQRLRTEGNAAGQIQRFTESSMREALGDVPVPEIVSGQRVQLMNRIRESVNANLADAGVDVVDVRIRRADLPPAISEGVYNRMRTARLQEAQRIRAEGEERARLIRARAERESTVLRAQAREQAETIRGDGDAQRNAIYADAYNQDADFFRFYRSLLACEASIAEGTQMVVSPESLNVCAVFGEQAAQTGR
ncbi:MAG: protease modulator HflC [Pseudomonadota bacterium]